MRSQTFSPVFVSFQQEGSLTHACIANGLTEIRNANIGNVKGKCYTGFFQLSIGIERIAKLVVIVEHMLDNNMTPPTFKVMKDFGHDLESLYKKVVEVTKRRNFEVSTDLSTIQERILSFLAKFAKRTRYANIDALTGQSVVDPLEEWNYILLDIFTSDVHNKTKEKIFKESSLLYSMMEDRFFAIGTDLDGNDADLAKWLYRPGVIDEASRYAVWHLVTLIQPITRTLEKLADLAYGFSIDSVPIVPDMGEFYSFLNVQRKMGINRKKW